MSRTKHRFYRKVLNVENLKYQKGEVSVDVKCVLYAVVESETTKTLKASVVKYNVYINNSLKFAGIEGRRRRKPIPIDKKNPLSSKYFKENDFSRVRNQAFGKAWSKYLDSLPELTAEVISFDKSFTPGFIKCLELDEVYPIYACNILGRKTLFPETASVYFNKKETIKFKFNNGLVVPFHRGHFDEEKWNSLDHDKLAFKVDDNGRLINGLMSPGASLYLWD